MKYIKTFIIIAALCVSFVGCMQAKAKVNKVNIIKSTITNISEKPEDATNNNFKDESEVQAIEFQLESSQPKKQVVIPAVINKAPVAAPKIVTPIQPKSDTTTVVYATDLENQVLVLVNAERNKAGIGPLSMDEGIRNSARLKSKEMCTYNYFAHLSPVTNQLVDSELNSLGITWRTCGENLIYIKKGDLSSISAQELVTTWINSPAHKANIVNPSFTKTGVGISWRDSDHKLEGTQQFTD